MSIKWKMDKSHSEAQFKVKHMVISTVTGEFLDFDATAESEDLNFTNPKFDFHAKVDSITTKNEMRDNHLKSADFFNADEHPELRFKSLSFDDESIEGELTIRGVTKPVKLEIDFGGVITDPYGNKRTGVEASGTINRKDFGLNYNDTIETGGLVVGDKVRLLVNLEFVEEK